MKADTQPVEAILFDFGGVFTDPDGVKAELRSYDRLLGWPDGSVQGALGSHPIWEAVSTGEISEEAYWQQAAGSFAARLPAAFARFKAGTLPFETLNEGMICLASALRRRVKTGLLSNATRSLRPYLATLDWPERVFDDIVISAEVGLRKPDSRIYSLAARRLDIPLHRCLLIDDKERNSISAREAGLRAITYTSLDPLLAELKALGIEPSLPGG